MLRKFKCTGCDTNYSTSGDTPPPSPRWDDGHVCVMSEVKPLFSEEDEAEADERMKIIAQNGNDGLHY